MGKLTPKEEAFAAGIAAGMSQAAAYRNAYPNARTWKDGTVYTKASLLAGRDEVQERVKALQTKAAEANEVTMERIVAELCKVAFGDPRQVMQWGPDGVKLKPSTELTDQDAGMVAEVSETISATGGSLRLKTHSKLEALKLLADLKGFTVKRTELTGKDGKDLVPAPTGVLVVPGVMSEDQWIAASQAALQEPGQ